VTAYQTNYHRLYAEDRAMFDKEFFKLVQKVVRRTVRNYPTAVYNDGEDWATTYDAVVQDVYLLRLLDPRSNQLAYIMNEATSTQSIERLLTRQTKQVILRRARRTPVDNLLRRIRAMADAGSLGRRLINGTAYYAPTSAVAIEPVLVTESDLRRAANLARQVPILWGRPDAERESKLYSSADLQRLMEIILSAISCISEDDLWRILEELLTSFIPSSLYLDEELGDTDVERNSSVLMAEMGDQIRDFVFDLDQRELQVLVAKSQGVSDQDIASHLNVSRPTVGATKSRVQDKMALVFRELGVHDSVEAVSRRIIELATIRLGSEEDLA